MGEGDKMDEMQTKREKKTERKQASAINVMGVVVVVGGVKQHRALLESNSGGKEAVEVEGHAVLRQEVERR